MALKKGGNFMGMMNVLMQLRKVCNHPDLFEPRSVVTPFIVPSLSVVVPSFICSATSSLLVMARLSRNLMEPLWCGSSGLPSIDSALGHDTMVSQGLFQLQAVIPTPSTMQLEVGDEECPDELKELLAEVYELRRKSSEGNTLFRNDVNRHGVAAQLSFGF